MKASKNTLRQYPSNYMPNSHIKAPQMSLKSIGSNKELNGLSSGTTPNNNRNTKSGASHPAKSARQQHQKGNLMSDSMIQDMEGELQNLRLEAETYKEKIVDLEKWLVLLLNNFYDGNPNSLKNIEQVTLIHGSRSS